MKFTYEAYIELLRLLKKKSFNFARYNTWQNFPKSVILRHDIDNSVEKAVKFAELEAKENVESTYFVLLCSNFYNVFNLEIRKQIQYIHSMGHQIGLHFDEKNYTQEYYKTHPDGMISAIEEEAEILSQLLEVEISAVSMHRPSEETLHANYVFSNLINSYSNTFFHKFKYISDSRKCWRENPRLVIECNNVNYLQILTHPIWYDEKEITIKESMRNFLELARIERYNSLKNNIRDFENII